MSFPKRTKLDRIDRTLSQLTQSIHSHLSDLSVEAWITKEPVPFSERTSGTYATPAVGEVWGELWDCAWFRFTGEVPIEAANQSVVLLIDLGGEGLIVDHSGRPVQGLTSISSGFDFSLGKPGKRVFPIANPATGLEQVEIWVDAGLNDLFGSLPNGGKLDAAQIAIRREDIQSLAFDFEVLRELVDHLPEKSARHASVLQALFDAALLLASGTSPSTIEAAVNRLQPELAKKGGDPSLTISAIGHAHIDLAWLWPIRETIRKGARTFSTVLRMMDRYPEYVFGASQPQLYQWMKDYYPDLYEEIKVQVVRGRWEVQGGMWVEPDANIPSGESLVRQLLYGKRFWREEFGIEVTNLWMPDVFGYSGSLPQILRKAGIDTFLTQKLSWSLFNQHPHHTFHWEGIDGSSVLVHMPPESTYNSSAAPRAIARAETDYLDKDVSDSALVLFGIGDGGGGPGEEHLERLKREKNLSGLAPVRQETSDAFFQRLKENAHRYARWRGELYLERHQGTLTSQARNKRFNRKVELALREAEVASLRAKLEEPGIFDYPSEALTRIWKEILLYQFHDILPGSSITRVFDESLARYAEILSEVDELINHAESTYSLGSGNESLITNSLSWERTEWVKVLDAWRLVTVPSFGGTWFPEPSSTPVAPHVSGELLENDLLCVRFSPNGEIISIVDKEIGREILAEGSVANQLAIYEDQGDAWDFPVDYDQVPPIGMELVSSEFLTDGPKATIRQVRMVGDSKLTQEISLIQGSKRMDFSTKVDWHERRRMLRTLFPLDIQSQSARCDIQFGNIERPTHANTSWDWARNEICAQKWIDISEAGYGVALLNDCKYGHSVRDNVLNLTLLRSATYPDPLADKAVHEFSYAILPHTGDYSQGRVVREAWEFNVPLRIKSGIWRGTTPASLIKIPVANVNVEAIKEAEDGDGWIVRLVEAHGRDTTTTVKFGFDIARVDETNLIEDPIRELSVDVNCVEIHLRPFEIVTLKVTIP